MSSSPLDIVSVGQGEIFRVYKCRDGLICEFPAISRFGRLSQDRLAQENVDNAVKFLFGKVVDNQPPPSLFLWLEGYFGAEALL
jgi:hypothetical protein